MGEEKSPARGARSVAGGQRMRLDRSIWLARCPSALAPRVGTRCSDARGGARFLFSFLCSALTLLYSLNDASDVGRILCFHPPALYSIVP